MQHRGESFKKQFESLVLNYWEPMYRLAYSRVLNDSDAQDIVQETYLKAFRAFPSLNQTASAKSWLSRILINTVRDHFRRSGRALPVADVADLDEFWEPSSPGPDEALCHSELDPDLSKALSSLPEQLVMPLLLREINEASYDEIAAILEIPKGTVMSRLHRARQRLRDALLGSRENASLVAHKQIDQAEKRGESHEV